MYVHNHIRWIQVFVRNVLISNVYSTLKGSLVSSYLNLDLAECAVNNCVVFY